MSGWLMVMHAFYTTSRCHCHSSCNCGVRFLSLKYCFVCRPKRGHLRTICTVDIETCSLIGCLCSLCQFAKMCHAAHCARCTKCVVCDYYERWRRSMHCCYWYLLFSLSVSYSLSACVCVCVCVKISENTIVSTQNVAIPMLDWPFFCFS